MKKIVFGLTILASLAACNQFQPMNTQMMPQMNLNQGLRMMSTSAEHPDFARKLANPRAYQFQPEARRSLCGKNDLQHVNDYDGSLGQPVEFVKKHQTAVGALAKGNAANSSKFCSGTLIGEDLFLTASHCIDSAITKDKFVAFNYERATQSPDLLQQEHFKITEVVEDGVYGRGLDYAILRLEGKPGLKFGFTGIKAYRPEDGHLLTIIQHPKGQAKQVESGPMAGESGNYMQYADLDTEPGSSGSGVLDAQGLLVGVHTNGGCYSQGGANKGVKMTEIIKKSKIVQELNQAQQGRMMAAQAMFRR